MVQIRLILPFPESKLNPNKRLHWAEKHKIKSSQHQIGYLEALPHKGKMGGGRIKMELLFVPPDNRPRDMDNLLASCKELIDCIAQGLGVNDKQFRPIVIDMGEKNALHSRVEIIFSQN